MEAVEETDTVGWVVAEVMVVVAKVAEAVVVLALETVEV